MAGQWLQNSVLTSFRRLLEKFLYRPSVAGTRRIRLCTLQITCSSLRPGLLNTELLQYDLNKLKRSIGTKDSIINSIRQALESCCLGCALIDWRFFASGTKSIILSAYVASSQCLLTCRCNLTYTRRPRVIVIIAFRVSERQH